MGLFVEMRLEDRVDWQGRVLCSKESGELRSYLDDSDSDGSHNL